MDLTPGVGLATALLDGAGFFCEMYKKVSHGKK